MYLAKIHCNDAASNRRWRGIICHPGNPKLPILKANIQAENKTNCWRIHLWTCLKPVFVALPAAHWCRVPPSTLNTGPRDASAYISQYQAAAPQIISDVRYELDFQLTGKPSFPPLPKWPFKFIEIPKINWARFKQGTDKPLYHQRHRISKNYNGAYISFKYASADPGWKHGSSFTALTALMGEGLHRFKDRSMARSISIRILNRYRRAANVCRIRPTGQSQLSDYGHSAQRLASD